MQKWSGQNKYDLDTPCLVIDKDILEENLKKMQAIAQSSGKQLRPHVKTHKCSLIAQKQMETGAVGLCTAKLSEAEVLVNRGFKGVLITGPVVTSQKIKRLSACLKTDPSLMPVVDNLANCELLNNILSELHLTINVLLDVDVGLERTGVAPDRALEFARKISAFSALRLRGIQAYAGQVQHIKSYKDRRQASLECMQQAADVFHQLRQAGFQCDIFSGGGTGTYDIDIMLPELTDLQVGSYALMDAEYLGIGSANEPGRFNTFRPALSLLTTVVSVNQKNFVTVDAGLKSLYKHGATPLVLDSNKPGLRYDWFGDEYGKIYFPEKTGGPKLGAVLELVVSHCDPTINQFDWFYVTQQDQVVDSWPIDLRGKSR